MDFACKIGRGTLLWYNKYIIKEVWTKHKRVVLIAFAVVFLLLLFFSKNSSKWVANRSSDDSGLVYGNELVGELLFRDTDGDGVLDWEEGLWDTDPRKADSDDDGVSDKEEIAKMKAERIANAEASGEISYTEDENLTETDKFARELFTTVAALNQTGEIDDATIEDITTSLALQIQTPVQRKVFTLADLKVTSDNSVPAYEKYGGSLVEIFQGRYPFQEHVTNVLQKFSEGGEDADPAILAELDPTIKNLSVMLDNMTTITVPSETSSYHLALTNALEEVFENLSDLRKFESDPVLAFNAINQYLENQEELDSQLLTMANLFLGNNI